MTLTQAGPPPFALDVAVVPFAMSSPGDASGVRSALRTLPPERVVQLAVLAKVEGTATLNDVSRELASDHIGREVDAGGGRELVDRTLQILSVGCEGIISPGGWLLASLAREETTPRTDAAALPPGLVMAHARSAPLPMEVRATGAHVDAAAGAVRAAMARAQLDAGDVALVLIKSPILLAGRLAKVHGDQRRHVASTAASRGAAALGVALALGEITGTAVADAAICADWSLYSARCMAFSGTETDCCEAVVLGHRPGGDPRYRIRTAVMQDILDCAPLGQLAAGGGAPRAVFFKAGLRADGALRDARTTVFTSELPPDKQLRAAASGVVGAMFGTSRAFVSGGAEHQGPPGACIAAVIAEV